MHEKRLEVGQLKKRLSEYTEIEKDIDNQIERLERIETKLIGLGSPIISDMPRNPSPSLDGREKALDKKREIELDIKALMQRRDEERAWIESVLKELKSADEKAVIRMRYVDGETWMSLTNMLFGAKDDYIDREMSYLRRAEKVHGRALVHMTEVILRDM